MKRYFSFVLFAAVVLASSCKKQNVQPETTRPSFLGKWDIVKDSTWAQLIGPPTISVYSGTVNDYYDFRADGKCYKQENGVRDTIPYKIASDTSVIFGNPVAMIDGSTGKTFYQEPGPTPIDPLTAHSAKIVFAFASPGGPYCKTIFLAK
ncbi:MAG: hypothetical protein JSU01_10360 [Bacteroidetes bacterium]|nr:hypothetical protein [Bacteroidota bacterium]